MSLLRCFVVKLFLNFSFSIFPTFQCLSCIFCHVKKFLSFFRWVTPFRLSFFHFSGDHFITFERATIENFMFQQWYLIKKLLWIFLASPTQRTRHETFWVLYQELLLMNVSETVCGIVLALLWFRIIGKTKKDLVFTITHICLINQASMYHPEAYSELCQTSKMERFAKIASFRR